MNFLKFDNLVAYLIFRYSSYIVTSKNLHENGRQWYIGASLIWILAKELKDREAIPCE